MLIIGELINVNREVIAGAIENQDTLAIQNVASDQFENGADYIHVNAGIFVDKEMEYLKWLVNSMQEVVDAPCCIDNPDPQTIEAALSVHKGTALINLISLEKDRCDAPLPIIAANDSFCMNYLKAFRSKKFEFSPPPFDSAERHDLNSSTSHVTDKGGGNVMIS